MPEMVSEVSANLPPQAEFITPVSRPENGNLLRRAAAMVAVVALTSGLASETAHAVEPNNPSFASSPDKMTAPPHMTAKQEKVWNACVQLRVVNHKGTNSDGGGAGPDVDTKPWIQQSVDEGHLWVELDGQNSSNHKTFLYHDATFNAGSNGTGEIWHRSSSYIEKLRTVHGQHVGTQADLKKIMADNPQLKIQYEFKDYGNEWSPSELKAWADDMEKAGLLDRVNVSSASPRVVEWFSEHHPEVYTEFIGFFDKQPNLWLAKKIGADQVNVDYVAAFHPYKGYSNYIEAARHEKVASSSSTDNALHNIAVSVRSKPTGAGDTPSFWLREVMNSYYIRHDGPVSQIVTQDNSHEAICEAVVQAAK